MDQMELRSGKVLVISDQKGGSDSDPEEDTEFVRGVGYAVG